MSIQPTNQSIIQQTKKETTSSNIKHLNRQYRDHSQARDRFFVWKARSSFGDDSSGSSDAAAGTGGVQLLSDDFYMLEPTYDILAYTSMYSICICIQILYTCLRL